MNRLLALTPRHLKLLLIALPLLLAAVYYVVFAADRYVSEAIVTVRQANQDQSTVPGATLMLAGVNPPSREETLYLRQYIHSLDLLKRLDAKLDLRQHYEGQKRDLLFRLYADSSQEWFLEYYRSRVEVSFDDVTSLLSVRVQGFEPAFAQRLNAAILEDAERFVNGFSQRMAREQMGFAETELQRSATRLQKAKADLLAFQTQHRLLDPMAQARATGTLTAELQGVLARQEAELRNALTYLNDDSYQIKALRSQVEATRAQLDAERLRGVTAGRGGDRLNSLAAQFQDLALQAGFAEDAYKVALTSVESSRIDAARKFRSLVVIEPPSQPQTAVYPRRLYNLATLLLATLLLYGIVRLVIATVREHLD